MILKINGRKIENSIDAIGLQNDSGVETIEFAIPRYYGDIDLADGLCYILLQYPSGEQGYSYLSKEVDDNTVTAIWQIDAAATKEKGTLRAQLKVSGLDAALWHSEITRFQVGGSILVETPAPQPKRMRTSPRIANPDNEQPITVSERQIIIPSELQSISVQNDQNSETVAIVVPRYFDGHDLDQYTAILKTISSGGRDDIPLLKTDTGASELRFSWTLKQPQTSFPGTLRLQIRFVGDEFKWETHSASVNIVQSLDGSPIIPTSPSILDGFADEMAAYVDRAAQSAKAADDSAKEAAAAAGSIADDVAAVSANAQAAAQSAAAAAVSEQNAAAAADAAAISAEDAEASIEETAQNAAAAETSAAAAAQSAQSAAASETAASGSAAAAGQSATAASTSAAAAAQSAQNAASSAQSASDDADAAAASAQAAAQSAADASQSASSIGDSAAAAAANAAKAETEADRAKSEADRAAQISHNMGWFADPDSLRAAYPTGGNGWFAIVGSTDSIWTWDADTSAWVDTGGGGQGVSDYTLLSNKPQINGVTLLGNKSLADLGVQPAGDYVLPGDLALYQPAGDYPTRTEVQQGYQPKGDYATNTALDAVSAAASTALETANAAMDKAEEALEAASQMLIGIPAVPAQSGSLTYNGSLQTPSWDNYSTESLEIGGDTSGTDAGSYTATFTPKAGYVWYDKTKDPKSVTWTIGKADVSLPTQSGSLTYTGSAQSPVWSGYDSAKLTLSGDTSAVNAGSYTAEFTPTSNYKWDDGTIGIKTVPWSIAKAAGSLSINKTSITLNASTTSSVIAVTRAGDGAITATSSNTSVATVSVSGTNVTVSSVGSKNGSATITIKVAEGTNYLAPANKTCSVTASFAKIYGVQWDGSAATTWSRTDDAAGFTNPVPYVAGATSYSSPFDNLQPWAGLGKSTQSGIGTVVKIPKYWYKWTKSGNTMKLQISDQSVSGFHVSPAHADRGDGKGERDVVYVGRYHCRSNYGSGSGYEVLASITRATARNGIHNLGSTVWQYDFAMYWTIMMLYLVEFGDWNGQKTIGYGCSPSGSKVSTGYTDSMPYHTGTTASSRTTYGGTQYRYIEGLWDNVFDWVDGVYFSGANVYCIKNPANFSDTSGGTLVGTRPTSSGYISAWSVPTAAGFEYALYPSAVAGSESTYVCDYCYYYSSGVVLRCGGSYGRDQNYGPFYLDGGNTASVAYAYIGCRLQVLP